MSCKYINDLTCSELNKHLLSVKMLPPTENSLSDGAEVAEMQRYFLLIESKLEKDTDLLSTMIIHLLPKKYLAFSSMNKVPTVFEL